LVFIVFNQSLTCHCWCRILLYFFEKRIATKSIKSIITMVVIIKYVGLSAQLWMLKINHEQMRH